MKFFLSQLMLISSLCASVACQAEAIIMDETDFTVRQTIEAFMKKSHIEGVAVDLYVNGQPRAYYFGYANQERHKKVDANTIFEVGSITKLFTSLLLAQEVNAGNMHLDDAVAKYFGKEDAALFKNITLLNLATHTSGLPLKTIATFNDLKSFLSAWQPAQRPGLQWIYSNIGIGLLGMTIQQARQQPIDTLYRQQLLLPLKMTPIAFTIPPMLLTNYAQGYDRNNQPAPQGVSMGLSASAGELKASPKDFFHFLSAALYFKSTPKAIQQAMMLTQTPFMSNTNFDQGLGWEIYSLAPEHISVLLNPEATMKFGPLDMQAGSKQFSANKLIEKTGTTEGFRSYIGVIPQRKTGIVILTNHTSISSEIIKAGRKILLTVNHIDGASFHAN